MKYKDYNEGDPCTWKDMTAVVIHRLGGKDRVIAYTDRAKKRHVKTVSVWDLQPPIPENRIPTSEAIPYPDAAKVIAEQAAYIKSLEARIAELEPKQSA